jgi:hypothetical protein
MATAENNNILVLDVEGTDGRERGDDQGFFIYNLIKTLNVKVPCFP